MAKIKEPKKYYCDCKAYCGGILGEVTRGQYRWHEKSRITDGSSLPPSLRQRRLEAGIDPQRRKRRKRSEDTSTSESADTTPAYLSKSSHGKSVKRRPSTTSDNTISNSKRQKSEEPVKVPDDNHQTISPAPGPPSASPNGSMFNFKIGRTLPGPPAPESNATVASSSLSRSVEPPAMHFPAPAMSGDMTSPNPASPGAPVTSDPDSIATATSTSQYPASSTNEVVSSAVQQVPSLIAATFATSAAQDVATLGPSLLPNPMQQLAAVMTRQQANLLTGRAVDTDENKDKCKRKEPHLNSIMRPSANSFAPQNLYSVDWCKQNKGGKRGEFAAVWDMMIKSNDPLVEEYKKRSITLKAVKKASSAGTKAPAVGDDAKEE